MTATRHIPGTRPTRESGLLACARAAAARLGGRLAAGAAGAWRGVGCRFVPWLVAVALVSGAGAAFALAAPGEASAASSAWWHVRVASTPSYLAPGVSGQQLVVSVSNVGDVPADGLVSPVLVGDVLPAGLKVSSVHGLVNFNPSGGVDCPSVAELGEGVPLTCAVPKAVAPYSTIELVINVEVLAGARECEPGSSSCEHDVVSVSGGGAPPVMVGRPVTVSDSPVPFGLQDNELAFEEEGGASDARAGSHPFQLTSTLVFNQVFQEAGGVKEGLLPAPVALPKDVAERLPAGLLGDPPAVPECSLGEFLERVRGPSGPATDACPAQSAVGVAVISFEEPADIGVAELAVPIFNVEPGFGEPARLGFYLSITETPILLDSAVRGGPGTGEEYAVTVGSSNTSQLAGLLSAQLTFWGAPQSPRHDASRGWNCLGGRACPAGEATHPPAFLTLPTSCPLDAEGEPAPLSAQAEVDSWVHPEPVGHRPLFALTEPLQGMDGCNQLSFAPTISAAPTTVSASSPSGLDFNLDFDDEGLTSPDGTAQSQLKDTTVVLPEGFTINPSSGVGLAGCTEADFARESLSSLPGEGCPNESQLGEVTIETPLLTQPVKGSIFIAEPYENPFPEPQAGHPGGTLVALYVVARNPETGVLIKLSGKVTPNKQTGQLTTTFEGNPQLPFAHFNFHFREGTRAPLITPPTCGTYTTTALLTSWAEPLSTLTDTSPFTITAGAGAGPCPAGGIPFNPQLAAGTLNNNAGSFSPLNIHITRSDSDQEISSFSTLMPEGLTGDLTGIPFCPQASIEAARHRTGRQEEAEPSCPAASQLGHSLVGTGAGSTLAYTPGRIYLAGPYDGDPFSLVSVTSAVVGPFDLGTVVLRFGLNIDPLTARVSADPSASEPIPTILDGIVTHVRDIRVYIDRPGFILNPTSCQPAAIQSTLTGDQGATATIQSRFQAASCANLKYQPTLAVSTAAKASKVNGASLHFKIAYPKNAVGTQSWMREMRFEIPKQLPARLTTIQKACLAGTFEHDRPACPPASIIGHVLVHTPILPVPLEGPLYFVSYGGAAFPDAVAVIKGYGVTIESHGKTFIDGKTGVTSATFESVPDVPFESIEVEVPQGPFSEFGANLPHGTLNFCGQKLTMPILFKAQNGMQIQKNIPVGVTGCPKGLTNKQKLTAALKACKKKHGKKRAACEHTARKRYGAKASKTANAKPPTRSHSA